MNAVPMILRGLQLQNSKHSTVSAMQSSITDQSDLTHRCDPLEIIKGPGPNLLIWSGLMHLPVLMLKSDGEDIEHV